MQEQIRIRTQDGQYLIIGGDFQSMLAVVRKLPGRRFQAEEKIWEIPCRVEEVQKAVEAAGFHVTADSEMGRPLSGSPRSARREPERVLIRTTEGTKAVVGGEFGEIVAAVKAIQGRRWLPEERMWEVSGSVADLAQGLATRGFQLVDVAQTATPASDKAGRRRDQVHIRTRDGEFWVVGGAFAAMLETIKGVEGRRFVSAEKLWNLPCSAAEMRILLQADGYELVPIEAPSPSAAESASDPGFKP